MCCAGCVAEGDAPAQASAEGGPYRVLSRASGVVHAAAQPAQQVEGSVESLITLLLLSLLVAYTMNSYQQKSQESNTTPIRVTSWTANMV